MVEHTKGRLRVVKFGKCTFIDTEDTEESNGLRVADCDGDDLISPAIARANARRLVAAWNFVEGLPTDWIEAHTGAQVATVAPPYVRPPFYVEPDSNYDLPVTKEDRFDG